MEYSNNTYYPEFYPDYHDTDIDITDEPDNTMVLILAIGFIFFYKFAPCELPDNYLYIAIIACAICYLYINGYI
ncbi:hypothetical protein AN641_09490 [Candidatus Epulonipiscioides gigas]|nr:hypothetical protein AN641_09490 [Epulopiscium sp. SCG-C07WGA-EpuloA2]